MQRVAIVSGALGLGTALVFGAAVLAAMLFPNGGTVQVGWNGPVWDKGIAVPMPMPAIEPDVFIDEGKGGVNEEDGVLRVGDLPAEP